MLHRLLALIVGVGCSVATMLVLIPACTSSDPIPLPSIDSALPEASFEGGR